MLLFSKRGASYTILMLYHNWQLFMNEHNPCLECGACCAFFRASFYWGESDAVQKNGVPVDLTEKLSNFRLTMKGTNQKNPWCIALKGIIGKSTSCSIHPQRSSTCRDFTPSWENGEPNERCDQARAAWQLAPLTPYSWTPRTPERLPRAA